MPHVALAEGSRSDWTVAKLSIKQNPDTKRKVVINLNVLDDVIASAPTRDWKLLLALLRWLGCRKSEALQLKWCNILWGQDKVRVPSPKTQRYEIECRLVPLFPELRPHLEEAYAQAGQGQTYVVNEIVPDNQRSGMLGKNLFKPMQAIIKQAGHEP